jgi:nucleotide-binding universal stress UspA family protein
MFHKILIGSDGSECARNAALLAAEIAQRFDSETVVVNAFDISFAAAGDAGPWSVPVAPEIIRECMDGELAAAESAVQPLLETLKPPYRMIQELGHPVDALLTVALREKADLIVVGSRGLTRLKEFFLGSVSHGVLHHAQCPVLIERGPVKPFERILLASDGSAGSQQAAAAAFALAKGFDACLSVLSVKEPSGRFHSADADPHPVKTPEELEEIARRCRAVEESVQVAAKETGVPYRICEEHGHAGETIVRYAENGRYDLIVMGSRGLGGFQRLMLGSASNYVAYHANCPVLIVR